MKIHKRVALVTGGNRGLGFELCRRLGAQGCKVLLGARNLSAGETSARTLRDEGHDVDVLALDMADPSSIAAAASFVMGVVGRLDILVNNAAILSDMNQQPTEVSDAPLRENFEINFFGPWQLTR